MNWLSRAAAGASVLANVAAFAGGNNDILRLVNGDVLHGTLVSASADEGVMWRRTDASADIVFHFGEVRGVVRQTRQPAERNAAGATVLLTNGDIFPGVPVSLSESALALDTTYAGRVTLRRNMLAALYPRGCGATVYKGPGSLAEWTTSSTTTWHCERGRLVAGQSGTIARNVDLPDSATIEFTVHWKGYSYPQFRFAFFADDLRSYSGNCYAIRPSSTYIRLYRYAGGSSTTFESAIYRGFAGKSKARFTLLVRRKDASVALLLDDKFLKRWVDTNGFAGRGDGVLFYAYRAIEISDISIAEWDGKLPGARQKSELPDKDTIGLSNGDRFSGRLQGITDGQASIKTAYSSFNMPLKMIEYLRFSGTDAEVARRRRLDIRLEMKNGGVLTLGLKQLTAELVTGETENCEPLSISLGPVRWIDFHPHREGPVEPDRDGF